MDPRIGIRKAQLTGKRATHVFALAFSRTWLGQQCPTIRPHFLFSLLLLVRDLSSTATSTYR